MAVFVTDGLLRKSLAAVRSLGKKGVSVHVGEKTIFNPAAFSKYSEHTETYPCPETKRDEFVKWVETRLDSKAWDVMFPMDDATMELAIENREKWESRCKLVLPPTESYHRAQDKFSAIQIAKKVGMSCPKTHLPTSMEEVKLIDSSEQRPILIKPSKSSGSRGVKVIGSGESLVEGYGNLLASYDNLMIQEYIPQGMRIDVCMLVDKQREIRSVFVQNEVRHFPIPMGPSTVQVSAERDDLVQLCKAFLDVLPWYGIIEFEFMVDPRDGIPKFMEVNTRFWNSLECAIHAGVDFPFMLYELAVNGLLEGNSTYETGKYCRNLLPGDLLHFISNKERRSKDIPFWKIDGGFFHDDILSREDPFPTIGFLCACLRFGFDLSLWRKMFKRSV
ncbi:MAG: ATP-grasp domain-containing protein [Bacillota bacterium]|nr:ATP-grasp domain-containing protein [Bacillota bacterium]